MKIDWQNIDTVLLDMDGTLLDLHFDSYFWLQHLPQVYAQKKNITVDQANAHLKPIFIENEKTLNWYSVPFWSQTLGFDIMQHKADVAHNIAYRPNAQAFLEQCRQNSGDLRMVTNGHRQVLDLKIQYTQIDQYFDQLICSHELSYPKEHLSFWEKLQNMRAFDPQRTLFIDDSEYVLDIAAQYGIAHIYSIAQPDSSRERLEPSKFPMIECFSV